MPCSQCHHINLIPMCLKHRQRPMRNRIIIRMRPNQHDRLPSPLLQRNIRLRLTLDLRVDASTNEVRKNQTKKNKSPHVQFSFCTNTLLPNSPVSTDATTMYGRGIAAPRVRKMSSPSMTFLPLSIFNFR